jgi:arylsulfatase A-like enzyme
MLNVVLIVLDAARADHVSCYGYKQLTTPNIDQLAAEGVLYENAITPAIWTIPSHASLFTGLYPSEHGSHLRRFKLPLQHRLLAEELQELGYQTIGLTCNGLVGRVSGLDRGFSQYREVAELFPGPRLPFWQEAANKLYRRFVWKRWDYGARRITRLAIQHLKKLDSTRPFFLFMNYLETHLKYRPPARLAEMFLPAGVSFNDAQRVNQNAWKYLAGQVEMTDRDFEILSSLYDAELRHTDVYIGQLVDSLRGLGLLDKTIFIITSDHGENLGEHAMMDHQFCLYDTLIRVPLVIRCPEVLPSSVRVRHPVQTLDLPSSILTWSRGEGAKTTCLEFSRYVLPIGPDDPVRPFTISEYLNPQLHAFTRRGLPVNRQRFDRRLWAIRTRTHKLIWSSDQEHELYDLQSDPTEEHNLFSTRCEERRRLQRLLKEWETEHGLGDMLSAENHREEKTDPAVEQRLRDLGYI